LKKEEMRLTIRFNPADPRHREAARILNESGRSKAIIVANALWEYSFRRDTSPDMETTPRSNKIHESAASLSQNNQPTTNTEDGLEDAVLTGLSQFRAD
jgi:hypothetical protein